MLQKGCQYGYKSDPFRSHRGVVTAWRLPSFACNYRDLEVILSTLPLGDYCDL